MRVLLDTHILLWALTDDVRLPKVARSIIQDATNQILYSVASSWEIAIKHALHPEKIGFTAEDVVGYCEQAGFWALPIENRHVAALETLRRPADAAPHNDPFDRIMIAQAKADALLFVTHDSLVSDYGEACVLAV
ncbi:PIN domain-containing protein [Eggerthellaceae bacterium zg-893]|nr:PIN domain-containing protein [Eggerthellaceae bacterium zg-893]